MARSKRSHYRCPACGYDVTEQLRIDVYLCPKCGGPISDSLCAPQPPAWRRVLAHLGALFVAAAVAVLMVLTFRGLVLPHIAPHYRRAWAITVIVAVGLSILAKLYAWLLEVIRQRP